MADGTVLVGIEVDGLGIFGNEFGYTYSNGVYYGNDFEVFQVAAGSYPTSPLNPWATCVKSVVLNPARTTATPVLNQNILNDAKIFDEVVSALTVFVSVFEVIAEVGAGIVISTLSAGSWRQQPPAWSATWESQRDKSLM